MHVFTFGGLTLSSADHMMVGRSCSSRPGRGRVGACGPMGLIRAVLVRFTFKG